MRQDRIERCILTGKIIERQKDKVTTEWKYVIEGQSIFGDKVGTVAKLSLTGKLFIIAVYRMSGGKYNDLR